MHFATEFWLTRLCFQRALGGTYLIAFLIAANQFIPLLGARGLQPVRLFVRRVPFRRAPSLFYSNCSDRFIAPMIWCGIGLILALRRKNRLTSPVGSIFGRRRAATRFICRHDWRISP